MKFRRRGKFYKPAEIKVNRNEYIKANIILVVDEDGQVLGQMSKQEGLKIAKQKELDLIEVAPKANPPVCKIMSWSKYKYELTKKRKEQKKNKAAKQKEMRFKVFIQQGALEHKLKKVKEFLYKKHPVKLQIRATGRATKEHMNDLKNKILAELEGLCEVDQNVKKENSRNITMIIRPSKATNKILKKDHGKKT